MDDFTVNNASDIQQTILPNGCSRSTSLYICSTDSRIIFRMTHGDQVSLIAGGSSNKLIGAIAETGLYAQSNGDAGSYVGAASFTVSISSPIYGVAKGASVYRNDFLSYQSSTEGLFSVLKSWEEGVDSTSNLYKSLKVMNLSLGSFKTNASQNAIIYSNYLKVANSINVNSDMVYVKAAGNSSCFISQQNCDPINAVLYGSKKFGSKVIIVGALDQAGGSIASYSNFAGAYSDRFVVEDGRGIIGMNGRYEQGTSFSAPRVTGYVAIVSQKFPNLNAEQLSNVILQTARYDTLKCNNSSTGCDKAIYGQGEASLSRALAPVGRLR